MLWRHYNFSQNLGDFFVFFNGRERSYKEQYLFASISALEFSSLVKKKNFFFFFKSWILNRALADKILSAFLYMHQ